MDAMSRKTSFRAFTLVELLVVIGVIAVLIGMLMPALSRARQQALQVQCMSNLRQVGVSLQIYSNNWKGQCYPPNLGDGSPPSQRWMMQVFKFGPLPDPPVNDTHYYTPKVMLCPIDLQNDTPDFWLDGETHGAGHSYLLNNHLFENGLKFGSRFPNGLSSAEVVLMGEKRWDYPDYYMNSYYIHGKDSKNADTTAFGSDYSTRVEPYKHGIQRGSNYLFVDLHVGILQIQDIQKLDDKLNPDDVDPWDTAKKDLD